MKTNTKKHHRAAIRRARPVHKRIMLHPLSIFMILAVGVCLLLSTLRSNAETLQVSAIVPAEPLTEPAIITSPHDQDHVHTAQIVVSGTCPDKSYVKLYQNGDFSGVAQCISNSFQINTTLLVGSNSLQARVFNLTDSEGPTSPPITVFFDVETTSPLSPTQTVTQSPSGAAIPSSGSGEGQIGLLKIITDYKYQSRYPHETWRWSLSITGGVAPYKISIDWGDSQKTLLDRADGSTFEIQHAFQLSGDYQPIIKVTDSRGVSTTLQLAAPVKALPSTGLGPSQSLFPPNFLDRLRHYLWAVWPAYSVVVLMVGSFWLGEQQELRRLLHKHKPRGGAA